MNSSHPIGILPALRRTFWLFPVCLMLLLTPVLLATPTAAQASQENSIAATSDLSQSAPAEDNWLSRFCREHRYWYAVLVTLLVAVVGGGVAHVTELVLRSAGAKKYHSV